MNQEIRQHVLRETQPPWRTSRSLLTECGKPVEGPRSAPTYKGEHVMSRAEMREFITRHGRTRAILLFCVTCTEASKRWKQWEEDPVAAMQRETAPFGPTRDQTERELLALSDLVRLHPEDFASLLSAREGTIDLAERRRNRRLNGRGT